MQVTRAKDYFTAARINIKINGLLTIRTSHVACATWTSSPGALLFANAKGVCGFPTCARALPTHLSRTLFRYTKLQYRTSQLVQSLASRATILATGPGEALHLQNDAPRSQAAVLTSRACDG